MWCNKICAVSHKSFFILAYLIPHIPLYPTRWELVAFYVIKLSLYLTTVTLTYHLLHSIAHLFYRILFFFFFSSLYQFNEDNIWLILSTIFYIGHICSNCVEVPLRIIKSSSHLASPKKTEHNSFELSTLSMMSEENCNSTNFLKLLDLSLRVYYKSFLSGAWDLCVLALPFHSNNHKWALISEKLF